MADLNKGETRLLIRTCKSEGLLRNQCAYVLGTSAWETGATMEPVREAHGETDEQSIARLERAWAAGKLPWVSKPYWRDGFFGRGFVQLTHEFNYAKAGRELGVDLVKDPSKALQPELSALITVRGMRDGWFTGKRLVDYITISASNYRGARRIVNGTDKATVIDELAREYESALIAEGYGLEPVAPVVNERRDGTQPRESKSESKTLVAQVTQWAATVSPAAFAWWQAESDMIKAAILVSAGLGIAAGVVIFRERLRYWARGIK